MLREVEQMPDEAEVFVFVATRRLTTSEQDEVRTAADTWLQEWHAFYTTCSTSFSRTLLDGWVLVWAIDDRRRGFRGSRSLLTGSDLDPLYERLERFAAGRVPP